MNKHTDALNVLNDELERVFKDILYLQTCLGKSKVRKHLFPQPSAMLKLADLRWERALKDQLKKSESLAASIKALEELEGE